MSDHSEDQPTDTPGSGDQPQEAPNGHESKEGHGSTGPEHEESPDLRPESAPPAPKPEGS
jgi:hypothetical protein